MQRLCKIVVLDSLKTRTQQHNASTRFSLLRNGLNFNNWICSRISFLTRFQGKFLVIVKIFSISKAQICANNGPQHWSITSFHPKQLWTGVLWQGVLTGIRKKGEGMKSHGIGESTLRRASARETFLERSVSWGPQSSGATEAPTNQRAERRMAPRSLAKDPSLCRSRKVSCTSVSLWFWEGTTFKCFCSSRSSAVWR